MYGQYENNFAAVVDQLRREFDQKLNQVAGGIRRANTDAVTRVAGQLDQKVADLASIARALEVRASGPKDPGTERIENIPGRRVPFDMLVDIPIGPDVTSVREQSFTVSQEGPFVAVKRVMAFQSALEFQVVEQRTGQRADFVGRSFGRYRPIHSACDVNDSQHNAVADTARWFNDWLTALAPGAAMPAAVLGLPSSMSSFRTMEFDGRVTVINAGSSYPRQRIEVPTTFWTTDTVSPQDLGALDFFERGETITLSVLPNHVNNPPAGNVSDALVFPAAAVSGFPFLNGQYDAHEGIATPGGMTVNADDLVDTIENDVVQRLPAGIVTIGYIGYRIIQSPGVAV
jgi:hypothetical protein